MLYFPHDGRNVASMSPTTTSLRGSWKAGMPNHDVCGLILSWYIPGSSPMWVAMPSSTWWGIDIPGASTAWLP